VTGGSRAEIRRIRVRAPVGAGRRPFEPVKAGIEDVSRLGEGRRRKDAFAEVRVEISDLAGRVREAVTRSRVHGRPFRAGRDVCRLADVPQPVEDSAARAGRVPGTG